MKEVGFKSYLGQTKFFKNWEFLFWPDGCLRFCEVLSVWCDWKDIMLFVLWYSDSGIVRCIPNFAILVVKRASSFSICIKKLVSIDFLNIKWGLVVLSIYICHLQQEACIQTKCQGQGLINTLWRRILKLHIILVYHSKVFRDLGQMMEWYMLIHFQLFQLWRSMYSVKGNSSYITSCNSEKRRS